MIKKKVNRGERLIMVELMKKYIGKDCIISTMDAQVRGIIVEIKDGWALVENKGRENIVNLEFVSVIREVTRGKRERS